MNPFYTLNSTEKTTVDAIVKLHNEKPSNYEQRILNLLISLEDGDSYLRLVADKEHGALVLEYLNDPRLQKPLFARLLNASFKSDPKFTITQHPTLSFAELYLGHRYYQLASECEQPNDFMQRALYFNSFHAASDLLARYNKELGQSEGVAGVLQKLESAFAVAMRSILAHGTPALINYALYFNAVAAFAEREGLDDLKDVAMKTMRQALEQAEQIAEDSKGSIHNAYFGAGVAASNEQGLDSLDAVKAYLDLPSTRSASMSNRQSSLLSLGFLARAQAAILKQPQKTVLSKPAAQSPSYNN